jgi:hypothetical protein
MEVKNEEKNSFHIYCDKHVPLKLKRNIETKDRKNKEEIIKFFRGLERYNEHLIQDKKDLTR